MSMSWRLSWCPISDVQMPVTEWPNRADAVPFCRNGRTARVGDARERDAETVSG